MPPTEAKQDFQEPPISNEDEDENSRNPPVPPPAETPISEGFPSNLPESTTSRGPIDNQDQDDYSFPELTEDDIQLLQYFLNGGSSSQQPAPAAESPSINLDPDNGFLGSFHGDPPPPPPFSTDFDNQTFPDAKYNETFPAETATNLPPATAPVEPLPLTTLGNIWPHLSVKQLIDLVMVGMKHADITQMALEMVEFCQIEIPNTSLGVIDEKLLGKLSLEQLQNLARTAASNHFEVMNWVHKFAETLPVLCTLHIYGLEDGLDIGSIVNAMSEYGDIVESQEATKSHNPQELCTIRFRERKSLLEAMKEPQKIIGGKVVYCKPKSL